jgi:hypothetical protein
MKTSSGLFHGNRGGGFVSSLIDNLKAIQRLVEQFKHSHIHAELESFARNINRLSRKEFLTRLQSVLTDSWHFDAQIICSVGAGIEGTRQAMLRGAACEICELNEHLIINLYGVSPAGNLIPLVVFDDGDVELEGIINIAPSPGTKHDDTREETLHAESQILALAFRNLKLAGALTENCPSHLRSRLSSVLTGFRGDSDKLAENLAEIANPAAKLRRLDTDESTEGAISRLLRFLATRIGVAWAVCSAWLTTR